MRWFRRIPHWECEVYEGQYNASIHQELMRMVALGEETKEKMTLKTQ